MAEIRIELNHDGIAQLLKSQEMESCVKDVASGIKSRCGEGYEVDSYMTPSRIVSSVYTETVEAMQDNLDNNTLLRSMK